MAAWDKRENESDKAFAAFVEYRNMGTQRSLSKVRDKIGKRSGYERQLEKWSSAYSWQERVSAWDTDQLSKRDKTDDELRVQERRMRRTVIQSLTDKVKEAIENLDTKDPSAVRAVISAAETVLEQSRREMNDLPTTKQEHSGSIGWAQLFTGDADGTPSNDKPAESADTY